MTNDAIKKMRDESRLLWFGDRSQYTHPMAVSASSGFDAGFDAGAEAHAKLLSEKGVEGARKFYVLDKEFGLELISNNGQQIYFKPAFEVIEALPALHKIEQLQETIKELNKSISDNYQNHPLREKWEKAESKIEQLERQIKSREADLKQATDIIIQATTGGQIKLKDVNKFMLRMTELQSELDGK